METIKISYLKLNLNHQILEYNDNFCQLFNLEPQQDSILNQPIRNIYALKKALPHRIFRLLSSMQINDIESFILIKNNRINDAAISNSIVFLYLTITKDSDSYSIRIVNWLNWVHSMRESLDHSYSFVSELDNCNIKDSFEHISDASCFKALYPLVTHVPNKFSNGISQAVLFDIMHLFIKQRSGDKCTKDYTRNLYSRLRTNLKQEFNLENVDIADFIKDDSLLALKYNDDIQIPNTKIVKNIATPIKHDPLLMRVINSIHPH